MTKFTAITEQFEKALKKFREVLDLPETDVVRDSAIQRFEFTLDLSWKMIKAFLEEKKGVICASPKECFREAYRQGIIEYCELWLSFVDMRNETAHTYKEETAERIYASLSKTLEYFESLSVAVKKNL